MNVDWDKLNALPIPDTLRLADGADVPHAVGTEVFNHYDMQPGVIERRARRAEPDTSGALPDGAAWWVDVRQADGKLVGLDGSRLCTLETARKRGWLKG